MTKDQAAAYLAAFIDGEGHISCTNTKRGRFTKQIAFSNTDKQLFDRVINIASILKLQFRVYHYAPQRKEWSPKWVAYLKGGQSSFEQFSKIVPLQCEKKKQTLADLLASYIDPETIYAKRRTSIRQQCPICTKEFFAFPADLKRGHGKYCSPKCGYAARRKQQERACVQCGSMYYVSYSRQKISRFCSQRCVGLSQAERLRPMAKKAAEARWKLMRQG